MGFSFTTLLASQPQLDPPSDLNASPEYRRHLATVLVRPGLFLNGKPVSVKLLEEVKLRINATDHAGIATSTEVPDFKLFEDRESIHEFRVPSRLASFNVTLQAKVKSLSQNKTLDL